jgi:hypothetical protein
VVTDVARALCCPDEVKLLTRKLEDTNEQLAECMQWMKSMTKENNSKQKQLVELEDAARVVVDMVEPPEEGAIENMTQLERLRGAPQRISSYLSETTKSYVTHVLGLVKSFWPKCNLSVLIDGMAADCSDQQFAEYLEEGGIVAQKIM